MTKPLRIGSLFSGYGGLDMAVEAVTGGRTTWVSDIDVGANKILARRYPDVPNIGDLTQVDWASLEPVDIITGGFPCQDLSLAGKRRGMAGARSGLWSHMARAIEVHRPALVVAENVRGLLSAEAHSEVEPCPWCVGDGSNVDMRALGAVLADLADIGYDAAWHGLTAASVGAPHGRFRVFVVAWPHTDTVGFGRRPARWDDRIRVAGLEPVDAANSRSAGLERIRARPDEPKLTGHGSDRAAAADAQGKRRLQGWTESARIGGRPDVAQRGDATDWGDYGPAIRQWERILGRPAPAPTAAGSRGGQSLNPQFVEFMMGIPGGHVTDVPGLTRNEKLKALGNGVVPQQAEAALRYLLRVTASEHAA